MENTVVIPYAVYLTLTYILRFHLFKYYGGIRVYLNKYKMAKFNIIQFKP